MNYGGIFDVDTKAERLVEVNRTLEDPKIWDDPKQAQALGKEKKLLDGVVGKINALTENISASQELLDMAKEEGDTETILSIQSDTEGMKKEDPTIAGMLKPLGYVTGQFGKNHLGDRAIPLKYI